ncbi:MAG: hypothetical protein ACNYWU_09960, partial [Desulfobacterales bacterium]
LLFLFIFSLNIFLYKGIILEYFPFLCTLIYMLSYRFSEIIYLEIYRLSHIKFHSHDLLIH